MFNNPCSLPGLATGTTMRSGRCTTSLMPSICSCSSPKLTGTIPCCDSVSRVTERSVRIGPSVAVTTITARTAFSTIWLSRPAWKPMKAVASVAATFGMVSDHIIRICGRR